jgi:hypothetical protein
MAVILVFPINAQFCILSYASAMLKSCCILGYHEYSIAAGHELFSVLTRNVYFINLVKPKAWTEMKINVTVSAIQFTAFKMDI